MTSDLYRRELRQQQRNAAFANLCILLSKLGIKSADKHAVKHAVFPVQDYTARIDAYLGFDLDRDIGDPGPPNTREARFLKLKTDK